MPMIPYSLSPYDLDKSNATGSASVTTAFFALACVSTVMRWGARWSKKQPFKWDDYLLLGALISGGSEVILFWLCITLGGTGRHLKEIGEPDLLLTLRMLFAFELLYNLSMTFLKCSIVAFYFRLFGINSRLIKWGKALMIATVVWAIASVITILLICQPLAYTWNPFIEGGHCGNRNIMFIINGVGNIVIDLCMLVLPIPIIKELQLPTPQKIGLFVVFSLGIFVTIISVVRLLALEAMDFEDITATLAGGMEWSCLEESIGCINANLPILWPIIKALTPKSLGGVTTGWSRKGSRPTGHTNLSRHNNTADGTFPLTNDDSHYLELDEQDSQKGGASAHNEKEVFDGSGTPRIKVTKDWNVA